MVSAVATRQGEPFADAQTRSLIVTWEHPISRAISAVAILRFDGTTYSFEYLREAADISDFRPLLGFPELDVVYSSEDLFPIFQQRVMDPKRPDYTRYVQGLGLPEDASPWEQITRSGGSREGDTIQFFPFPEHDGSVWTFSFMVNGVRHMLSKSVPVDGESKGTYAPEDLERLLGSLSEGDGLELHFEPTNDYDSRAILVLARERMPIGYVPTFAIDGTTRSMRDELIEVTVERVNPAEAGWHMRVLARMTVSADENYEFFPWQ